MDRTQVVGLIDFASNENAALINPRMPAQRAARVRSWLSAADHLGGHVFVLTSGSTAESEADYKWVALSKKAVLAAAAAANQHLSATGEARAPFIKAPDTGAAHGLPDSAESNPESRSAASDVWFHCLPDFHVGGLGIWARAYLSGASVVRSTATRWDPTEFATAAGQAGATLCSLVPTQVYDLVQAEVTAPNTLRAVAVGGGALGEAVYERARSLGWPILPSYGMTEAASQIATAPLVSLATPRYPALRVLPHLEVEISREDGCIRVRGTSLLSGMIRLDGTGKPEFVDPKDAGGWLTTDDFGAIGPDGLVVLGRVQDRVKIGGELVNLAALRRVLEEEAARLGVVRAVALTAIPDGRLESVIAIIAEPDALSKINELKACFEARVLPYERIRHVLNVERIPRTELGKIKWSELSSAAPEQ